jgi:DNA mismatch repair protein MSH3
LLYPPHSLQSSLACHMSQRASKGSPTKSQATILAFFSTPASSSLRDSTQPWSSSGSKHKRNASPIDLTGDDELESHVAKKLKGSTTSRFFSPATQPSLALFHNSQSTPAAAAETTTAQQWRFGNGVTSQLPSQALFSTEASEKIRRHEAFKKTLLGESNPFARRKALEDANSVEELFRLESDVAHGQVPSDEELDPEPEMAAPSPVKKGRGKKKAPGPKPDEDEDEDSDPGFKNMLSGFSAKGKGKTKAVVKPPATKKTEALGPAGVPWTPLELQVSYLPLRVTTTLT